jgi:hypothetical protein
MEPQQFDDGCGFKSIVILGTGQHCVISEVHRKGAYYSIDEVLVFKCDSHGDVVDWSEIWGESFSSTDRALADLAAWRF